MHKRVLSFSLFASFSLSPSKLREALLDPELSIWSINSRIPHLRFPSSYLAVISHLNPHLSVHYYAS